MTLNEIMGSANFTQAQKERAAVFFKAAKSFGNPCKLEAMTEEQVIERVNKALADDAKKKPVFRGWSYEAKQEILDEARRAGSFGATLEEVVNAIKQVRVAKFNAIQQAKIDKHKAEIEKIEKLKIELGELKDNLNIK